MAQGLVEDIIHTWPMICLISWAETWLFHIGLSEWIVSPQWIMSPGQLFTREYCPPRNTSLVNNVHISKQYLPPPPPSLWWFLNTRAQVKWCIVVSIFSHAMNQEAGMYDYPITNQILHVVKIPVASYCRMPGTSTCMSAAHHIYQSRDTGAVFSMLIGDRHYLCHYLLHFIQVALSRPLWALSVWWRT